MLRSFLATMTSEDDPVTEQLKQPITAPMAAESCHHAGMPERSPRSLPHEHDANDAGWRRRSENGGNWLNTRRCGKIWLSSAPLASASPLVLSKLAGGSDRTVRG